MFRWLFWFEDGSGFGFRLLSWNRVWRDLAWVLAQAAFDAVVCSQDHQTWLALKWRHFREGRRMWNVSCVLSIRQLRLPPVWLVLVVGLDVLVNVLVEADARVWIELLRLVQDAFGGPVAVLAQRTFYLLLREHVFEVSGVRGQLGFLIGSSFGLRLQALFTCEFISPLSKFGI